MTDKVGQVVGHIANNPKTEARGMFPSAPIDLAGRVLEDHQERILVVHDYEANKGMGTQMGWWLNEHGIWSNDNSHWKGAIANILDEQLRKAANQFAGQGQVLKDTCNAINALRKRNLGNLAEEVRASVAQACTLPGREFPKVTWCDAEDLDADLDFIGCQNGVVCLRTAKLLDEGEGRKKRITKSTGVEFDPAATHRDVDNLIRHLPELTREWWAECLGVMMWGDPHRRLFFIVGPPKGGKSAMADAIWYTLGPAYVSRPSPTAFGKPGQTGSVSPEKEAFTHPRRFALMDEINKPGFGIEAAWLKQLSGGDSPITFRRLHEAERTRPVTATMLFLSNPMSVPKIRLNDPGVKDRYRRLNYTELPNPDPSFRERIKTPEFRKAFLAFLVNHASRQVRGKWPGNEPPEVLEATEQGVDEDIGEIGRFARRLVKAPGEQQSVKGAWGEWCTYNEDNLDAKESGGVKSNFFSRIMKRMVDGLPDTQTVRVNGKPARGWKGWKLLSVDEFERLDDKVAEPEAQEQGATVETAPEAKEPEPVKELPKFRPHQFKSWHSALRRGTLSGQELHDGCSRLTAYNRVALTDEDKAKLPVVV